MDSYSEGLVLHIKHLVPTHPLLHPALDTGSVSALAYLKAHLHHIEKPRSSGLERLHELHIMNAITQLEEEAIALAQSQVDTYDEREDRQADLIGRIFLGSIEFTDVVVDGICAALERRGTSRKISPRQARRLAEAAVAHATQT